MMGSEILVTPVGEVETGVLAHICAALTETFGRPCCVGEALPAPEAALNPRRGQYAAEAILRQLQPGEADRALGVVDRDLYVPELNFVFGLADGAGRRAVIALPRLRERFYGKPDDKSAASLFLARAVKEAVHELGHTYEMRHCSDRRCVMAFSNSLVDTDYKSHAFCPRHRRQPQLSQQKGGSHV
jgi:archaemetzincin